MQQNADVKDLAQKVINQTNHKTTKVNLFYGWAHW